MKKRNMLLMALLGISSSMFGWAVRGGANQTFRAGLPQPAIENNQFVSLKGSDWLKNICNNEQYGELSAKKCCQQWCNNTGYEDMSTGVITYYKYRAYRGSKDNNLQCKCTTT
jgi:hypothetical protein